MYCENTVIILAFEKTYLGIERYTKLSKNVKSAPSFGAQPKPKSIPQPHFKTKSSDLILYERKFLS